MKSICIMGLYFGNLRSDFPMWLRTCEANSSIDWIIISDQSCSYLPKNVRLIKMSFGECRQKIQNKFDFQISLDNPYKLCDYKPAYGYIFDEYLKHYDFWGYCDFDMLFGDIRSFITDEILDKNDKILQFGHLSLYRNIKENNEVFMLPSQRLSYIEVFSNPKIYVFDEIVGIFSFYKKEKKPVYVSARLIDVSPLIKTSLIRADYFDKDLNYKTNNYRSQIFAYIDNKVYFVYFANDRICYEEELYIHYSGRKFHPINDNNYLITKKGYIPLVNDISYKDLIEYNRRNPFIEKMVFVYKKYANALMRRLKGTHSVMHIR